MIDKINIVIPMAGKSQRFFDAGYTVPKFLLPMRNKINMIQSVLENLFWEHAVYTIIINKNQIQEKDLDLGMIGRVLYRRINIIEIDYVPRGPACSALLAKKYVNDRSPLIITNCDQIIEDLNIKSFLNFCRETHNLDGCLGTFHSTSPKNSYVRVNSSNEIIELKEKQVISNLATNGFHYWKTGESFVSSTEELIKRNVTVNGEFYISETYNILLENSLKLMPYHFNLHFPIGTPEDYQSYLIRINQSNDKI